MFFLLFRSSTELYHNFVYNYTISLQRSKDFFYFYLQKMRDFFKSPISSAYEMIIHRHGYVQKKSDNTIRKFPPEHKRFWTAR